MRVLMVTSEFPPLASGIGDYTRRLSRELGCLGHEVCVLTGKTAGEDEPEKGVEGIRVERRVADWGFRGFGSLCRIPRQWPADVINLQYVPHAYGWLGVNVALPLAALYWKFLLRRPPIGGRARLVLTCHELYLPWSSNPFLWPVSMAHRLQLILLAAGAHQLIVVTEEQRRRLRILARILGRPVQVIPVGCNINPESQGRDLGAKERPEACHLGILALAYDSALFDRARQVAARLREKGLPARLICLGGKTRGGTSSEDWIETTGYLPEEELSRQLGRLDLFLALRSEGPTTRHGSVIAALAHGLPVLAVQGRRPGQELFWKDSGVVMAPDSLEAMAREAETLLKNPERLRRLSKQARAFHRRHFRWESIARQVESVFQGALA